MIAIQNMTKVYGMGDAEVHALGGVSLEIAKGEWVAITEGLAAGERVVRYNLGPLKDGSPATVKLAAPVAIAPTPGS